MAPTPDLHTCPAHQGHIVRDGTRHVFVEGFPVACVAHPCLCVGGPLDPVATGSATVSIGGKPVARKGEFTSHGGVIATGATSVEIGGPSTTATLDSPLGPLEVIPGGQPMSRNQVTKDEYLRLWEESKLPDQDWGGWDVIEWKVPSRLGGDANHLRDYKDQWIRDHATSIRVAARMNDIPPLLLAGTAWIEVGGDPTWVDGMIHAIRSRVETARDMLSWANDKVNDAIDTAQDAVAWIDEHDGGTSELIGNGARGAAGVAENAAGWIAEHDAGVGGWIDDRFGDAVDVVGAAAELVDEHDAGASEWVSRKVAKSIGFGKRLFNQATRAPELTSAGDVSIQIRRVAEILGMDPSKLSYNDRSKILEVLSNDQSNLSIVARHLRDLSQVDFAGQSILDDEAIRIIGGRYNRGPELSREAIEQDTSYGDLIVAQKEKLNKLLMSPTATTSVGSAPQPIARGLNPT